VLDSLPSLPYVAAMGVDGWLDNTALHIAMMDMSMSMMGPDSIYKIDEKDKAKLLELNKDMAGMVTGVQLVIGAAPKGKGMGSLSEVIKCKDSAMYMAAFPESIEIFNRVMADMEMPPGAPKFSMTYAKGVEKIGDLSVDAMNITLSGLPDDADKQMPGILKMILGEESIRMLIAAPDAKTLVVTVGGSIEALKETLKVAASGTGPIPELPGTAMAMRNLPENPSIVALLNGSNLMEVIRTGMQTAGAPPSAIEVLPVIKCKTPIAFGLKSKGDTLQTGLFVPKPLINETVQAVMMTMGRIAADATRSEQGSGSTPAQKTPAPVPGDF
jgi:hypothetical protein